jgi:hypothetical protein
MSTIVIILASIGILAMFGYMIKEFSSDKKAHH